MENTREIFWNIGNGAGVLIPMYVLTLAAFGLLVRGAFQRIKVYRQGRSVNRTDDLRVRVGALVLNTLGQIKVLRVKGPGIPHALFFWSFILLFAGTCIIIVQADVTDPLFGIKFLTGAFYRFFSVTLDLAGLLAIIMLAGLFTRRYLLRPEGLETKNDDAVMHGLLFAILVTGFIIEGARMAATELGTPLSAWSPVGLVFAKALGAMDESVLRTLHRIAWWGHFALVVAFIAILPFTKLRHIVTTGASHFFADRRPTGSIDTLDLEDEEAESFGANKITALTWKDIFDADACTLCKRCQDRCPAHATGKPLSPMKVVSRVGEAAFEIPQADLIEMCGKEALWSCTTCRACQEICPAGVEHVNKIIEMRRHMVLMEGAFPGEEVLTAVDNTEVNGNPLGLAFAARGDWAEGLPVSVVGEDTQVDILYFVGCYASFDKRNIRVARSFVELCAAAGVKVGILGKEEKCCGEPMRKLGNEHLYQSLAIENIANIEVMKACGVKKVVTTCPHCFNTLSKDYREFGFDMAVEHYTVYLDQLLKEGNLKIKKDGFRCTYHDSCYLGRYNGTFDQPRALVSAAGGSIAEMDRRERESFCCGAGGGRILAEEKIGGRINVKRVNMAAGMNVRTLVSNCPFCLTMFEDGVKVAELEEELRPRDIAEILVERLAK